MEKPRPSANRSPALGPVTRKAARGALSQLLGTNIQERAAQTHYNQTVASLERGNRSLARLVAFCSAFHHDAGVYSEQDAAAHKRGFLVYLRSQEIAVRSEGRRLDPLTDADTTNLLDYYVRRLSPEIRRGMQVVMHNEFSAEDLAQIEQEAALTPPGTYLPGEGPDQWMQGFLQQSAANSPFYEQHLELMRATRDEHRELAAAIATQFTSVESVFATELLSAQAHIDPRQQVAGQLLLGAADVWLMLNMRSGQ